MKVLLIGDYSAVHKNLATGLRQHEGVLAHVASFGDGFKGYSQDILFGGGKKRTFQRKLGDFKRFVTWFNQYDIIQMINIGCLDPISIVYLFLRSYFPMKAKLFCATVGCDYQFWTEGRKNLKMPLFDEVEKYKEATCNKLRDKIAFTLVNATVSGFLGFYEYYDAYAKVKKRLLPILQPIDLSELSYNQLDLHAKSKIIIYHGIQQGREGFKGSNYISQAFEILNKKYPHDVECLTQSSLPYKEYLSVLKNIHILLDQTNGISYGMNALISMAMGRVVGSGSQDPQFLNEWCKSHGLDQKPPIFPIFPDKNHIISQVERILDERENLIKISQEGRQFVEKYHDCKKVAEIFLDRWSSI